MKAKQKQLTANPSKPFTKKELEFLKGFSKKAWQSIRQTEKNRNQRLMAEIVDGRLVVSIGIDTLKFAAEHCDDNPRLKILDVDVLAKDVEYELEKERDETGQTALTKLFDEAVNNAFENGSVAFSEEAVPIV